MNVNGQCAIEATSYEAYETVIYQAIRAGCVP